MSREKTADSNLIGLSALLIVSRPPKMEAIVITISHPVTANSLINGRAPSSIRPKSVIIGEIQVRQIVHYCINSGSRYGFIITDEELVVLRIRTELTGDGLTLTRLVLVVKDWGIPTMLP